MLKITLENGSAYEVLHETACYPSMSTTARSYLEIHMSADAMTLDEFYTLMTDSEATKKITLQNIDAENPEKEQRHEVSEGDKWQMRGVHRARCECGGQPL